VVGRSAALILPFSEETPTISAFIKQCRTQNGWLGMTALRHRDGRTLSINLRISMLWGQDETVRGGSAVDSPMYCPASRPKPVRR
jgi:hypothetical protein